ncbi:MAG: isoleucine--tRNA ligase [bacterium]|nr:isoleucine--tRNA ligase [bacterium]
MNNFPKKEEEVLKFWKDNQIFEKSLEQTKDNKPFVFYDGPPFATGTPHYGNLLQSVIKDVIPRYKTMQGFYVERQWGWDCHGLPIENIVEKELQTKSKKDIVAMGVKKFNDLCRERIFTFISEWERIIPRFGRWVDMENSYRTMDFEYMQSEWWAFKELYKKGLIYEDYRSMHICPRCETTLSQGEVADGYKNIKDLSVTVKFKVKDSEKHGLPENTYLLAWTTTPWTLPGNVALAVGKDIEYVAVEHEKDTYVYSLEFYKKSAGNVDAVKNFPKPPENSKLVLNKRGKDLVGLEYEPLFDYYEKDKNLKNRENGWRVYEADFVTAEDGTGIAHEAPTFGADDWSLLKQVNLPYVQHVKMDGTFKSEVVDFPNLDLKPRAKNKPEEIREADLTVVKYLEEKGLVFDYKKYEHSYPHCWRCDTPLLNYATSSWFVAVEKIKSNLLKTAKKINWSPEHIKEGRFGQWLTGAHDWSISRQRFWANTIPVWRCQACNKEEVFASADELEKKSGMRVSDLHKDVVDEVVFTCSCDGQFKRVPDVLDTWFDSGSMPFATLGYPVTRKNELKKRLPADFIGEAQDQTRAWFYYQHVLMGALFNTQAFKNCIVTGIVLAEDGKKMSKKLQNYPDPTLLMEKYGADALRFYMVSSPVVQAENLAFSEKGVDEIARKNIGRLSNVLEFYKLYENDTLANTSSKNILDVWILARLNELVVTSTQEYEQYRLDRAVRPLTDFIDDLSVWYLRRSRERFKEENDDKKVALATLRYVLHEVSRVMAPIMPFFAEYLFQAVREVNEQQSVHLTPWPKFSKKTVLVVLEQMLEVRKIVTLALAQRSIKTIKVRQPLAKLKVKSEKVKEISEELLNLVKDEVNVKEIVFDDKIEGEVELDLVITKELKEEGMVRDVVRAIQDFRKEQNLTPQDQILLWFLANDEFTSILGKNKDFLMKEVRAKEIFFESTKEENLPLKEVVMESGKYTIILKKI